jgi:hypothetical protein
MEQRLSLITLVDTPPGWGGYSGVFVDPVGHPWEVAHDPGWTIHDDGRTTHGQAGSA